MPRFPIAPGQPIPLATGALAATIPAPVVFDATFPSTANFTRTGSTVGDWTVYASQKELSARPTAAKDALDVSIFWHGKLRTMANPYYGDARRHMPVTMPAHAWTEPPLPTSECRQMHAL